METEHTKGFFKLQKYEQYDNPEYLQSAQIWLTARLKSIASLMQLWAKEASRRVRSDKSSKLWRNGKAMLSITTNFTFNRQKSKISGGFCLTPWLRNWQCYISFLRDTRLTKVSLCLLFSKTIQHTVLSCSSKMCSVLTFHMIFFPWMLTVNGVLNFT